MNFVLSLLKKTTIIKSGSHECAAVIHQKRGGSAVRISYDSYNQFLSKAAVLAHELALPLQDTRDLLAKLSDYDDVRQIQDSDHISPLLPSRQDLIFRLMKLRPEICLLRAEAIINALEMPMRDANMYLLGQKATALKSGAQSGKV